MGERERGNFVYSSLWDFKSSFTTWDLPALLFIRDEGVLRIFIALKNPSPCPGFETATFGSSVQHTNHYTTKATAHRYLRDVLQEELCCKARE
jgi:hypothetical protein